MYRLQVNPLVMDLPDPAAAAPVGAAADPVLLVPAAPAVPVVPAVPVAPSNSSGPQAPVSARSTFHVEFVGLIGFPMKTFWKKSAVISLFLLGKQLLVSWAVMS